VLDIDEVEKVGAARLNATNDSGDSVLDAIEAFVQEYVVCPNQECLFAIALWIVHTHLMDRWDSTPRLAALSPEPGSGKTRLLEILELLVLRPVLNVGSTSAYLFRKISSDEGPPTILYDEIDTIFGPKAGPHEEIRALINAGHKRGAMAGRVVKKGNNFELEELPAYCAVAVAGLGYLPDTILTRSIVIKMRKRHSNENVKAYRRRAVEKQASELRERITVFAESFPEEITDWPDLPENIEDRAADVWEPLITIADHAGGDWPSKARVSAVTHVAQSTEQAASLGVQLLTDIKEIFSVRASHTIKSNDLISALWEIEESPWADFKVRGLTTRDLARMLGNYGIKPSVNRVGPTTARGYSSYDFHDAWSRYCPERRVTGVTSETKSRAWEP